MKEKAKPDWRAIAANERFVALHRKKSRFLLGWWSLSAALYFLLTIGAGFAPQLYRMRVGSVLNVGLLLALSQFAVSWAIAYHYARVAGREFDPLAAELSREIAQGGLR